MFLRSATYVCIKIFNFISFSSLTSSDHLVLRSRLQLDETIADPRVAIVFQLEYVLSVPHSSQVKVTGMHATVFILNGALTIRCLLGTLIIEVAIGRSVVTNKRLLVTNFFHENYSIAGSVLLNKPLKVALGS